ncbi:MAG: macro domain-containing protein [Clostridia bacterium]|nr:macro domain-containing protein [Clostridia bacterium]
MPLKIIRQDITEVHCDAIVDPSDCQLKPGGGVDLAVHLAAGEALDAYCQTLGGCAVGKAVITPAFSLPARYVIHTVGPDPSHTENREDILVSCYRECLKLALENGCESVAFPLIGAGAYGCPPSDVLRIATRVITEFLYENEMLVYLVVYDKSAFSLGQKVFADITAYIDDHYVALHERRRSRLYASDAKAQKKPTRKEEEPFLVCESAAFGVPSFDLDDMIRHMDKGFADTLFFYIDRKGISDVDAYKRSNVDKKTFSKIKCRKDYKPSKLTAVSFAIGLKLNEKETEHLLRTAGFCLSNNSLFDVIIRYFVTTGKYESIFDVNEVLYSYDQVTLGV